MKIYRVKHPFIFTIFGASGDLARLKLFPALYSLAEQKRLPSDYFIVGYARTPKNNSQFQKEFSDSIKKAQVKDLNPKILKELIKHVHYFTGQYDNLADFKKYKLFLEKLSEKKQIPHLTYFSVPPQGFKPIIQNLGESRKNKNEDIRLIIEKPFGQDEKSADDLFHFIARYFNEDQTYLLDHFLGKAGVQSILNLRQTNRILNIILQGRKIANIQITAIESIGINNRVNYFNQVGIIKDMIQSHLLQILALTTMSIPISESAASLQREKYAIISAVTMPIGKNNPVIGQYKSYTKENGVPKNSRTETFAAVKMLIDQDQWYKVPIYIRTGKRLNRKQTSIVVEFKKFPFQKKEEEPNLLIIEISPEEKVTIQLVNKYSSGKSHYETISTTKSIACSGDYCLPEHGLLLLDVMRKNKCSFLSFPEIIESWRVTESIFHTIKSKKIKLEKYDDGTVGPASQNKLTEKDGFKWHN